MRASERLLINPMMGLLKTMMVREDKGPLWLFKPGETGKRLSKSVHVSHLLFFPSKFVALFTISWVFCLYNFFNSNCINIYSLLLDVFFSHDN